LRTHMRAYMMRGGMRMDRKHIVSCGYVGCVRTPVAGSVAASVGLLVACLGCLPAACFACLLALPDRPRSATVLSCAASSLRFGIAYRVFALGPG
jgi:hypothetical protein